jgi:hypothetical protein
VVRSMFDKFVKNTVERVKEEMVGSLEDEENVIKILVSIETRELLVKKMKEEENQTREKQLIDAWGIKNYTIDEFLRYMEDHKLSITKNNFEAIKKDIICKFLKIENFVRKNRKIIKVQFDLSEDYLPKVEPPKKKEILIEFKKAVREIDINQIITTERSIEVSPKIKIEDAVRRFKS